MDTNKEINVTWLTLNWAQGRFERWVREVYADPISYGLEEGASRWFEQARGIAKEIKYDFDAFVDMHTTKAEQVRMNVLADKAPWENL